MANFMNAIYAAPLGPSATDGNFAEDSDSATPSFDAYGDEVGDEPRMPEADSFTVDAYDKYIGAQLRMPLNDALLEAKVLGRARDGEGNPIGISHANPLQDTRVYEVEFQDGSTAEYGANLIATAMFALVDDEGRAHQILDEIVDHRKTNEAASREEAYVTHTNKQRMGDVHPLENRGHVMGKPQRH
jgi:hypothetical protein